MYILNFVDDDAKLHRSQIQQIFDECGIPNKYIKAMFELLCRFELAIPLDSETLLMPLALRNNNIKNKIYSSLNCNFPRNSIQPQPRHVSYSHIIPPVAHTLSTCKRINLLSTGMCFRRLFLAHHIPENFWHKLIPRFIASAKNFYGILLCNCIEGMTIERITKGGDAVICNNHCRWLYWCNGITLTFGNDVLFSINGLLQCDSAGEDSGYDVVPLDKIRATQFYDGHQWKQLFSGGVNGFEVKVPDYKVESFLKENHIIHSSFKLGSQILSHVLEILNELSVCFVKGDFDKGIYSGSYFDQLVMCSYCYGDSPVTDLIETTSMRKHRISTLYDLFSESIESSIVVGHAKCPEGSLCGFNIQFCILKAQKEGGSVVCPNHGIMELKYLTPDLVCVCMSCTYMYVCACAHVKVAMCEYMYICVYVCVLMFVCVCTCVWDVHIYMCIKCSWCSLLLLCMH